MALGIFLYFSQQQRTFDWRITLSEYDKDPYGTFLTFELLNDLFPDKHCEKLKNSIYQTVNNYKYHSESEYEYEDEYEEDSFDELEEVIVEEDPPLFYEKPNFVFLSLVFQLHDKDSRALEEIVHAGAHAFIGSFKLQTSIAELADIENSYNFDSTQKSFVLTTLPDGEKYTYINGTVNNFFTKLPANADTLALNQNGQPVLIRLPHGKGAFIISCAPVAYTNFNILKKGDNYHFAAHSFSKLPIENTIWRSNYVSYEYPEYERNANNNSDRPGILSFIHSEPALTWAFYLALGTILLFMIVAIKRKQRIIPIQSPPSNSTLEFVNTIGQLYLQRGNHKNIAEKMITYFLEYIRSKYYINTNVVNHEFIERLSVKSGVSHKEINEIFNLCNYIQTLGDKEVNQSHLIDLNRRIDKFKKRSI